MMVQPRSSGPVCACWACVLWTSGEWVRRSEEAKDLFAAISGSGFVPNASTYDIMIQNLLREGSVEEADNMFSSMEKSGCAPSSRMLNNIIREIGRAHV